MIFCKCVISVPTLLLLIIHDTVYSNIFDIAESLTQNNHGPILAIQPSNVALVGRPM